jgi:hypothetical protein
MATYLEGAVDYIPQIQPFAPNLNLYANVLQTKQSKYDSNWKSLNNVYSQYFYADLSREDNQERRDDLMTAIDFNLKKVSGLDLSLEQNVRQAKQLFTPFYEDKYLMKDMVRTKNYMQERQRGLSLKNSKDDKSREQYWDAGIKFLDYQMQEFKDASLEESLNFGGLSYTPFINIQKKAMDLAKQFGNVESPSFSPDGRYMIVNRNGEQLREPLHRLFEATFGNDPAAQEMFQVMAYVNRKDYSQVNASLFGGDAKQAEMKYLQEQFENFSRIQQVEFENQQDNLRVINNKINDLERQEKNGSLTDAGKKALREYRYSQEIIQTNLDRAEKLNTELNIDLGSLNSGKGFQNPYEDIETLRRKVDGAVANSLFSKQLQEAAQNYSIMNMKQTVTADPFAVIDYRHQKSKELANYKARVAKEQKAEEKRAEQVILGTYAAVPGAPQTSSGGVTEPMNVAALAQQAFDRETETVNSSLNGIVGYYRTLLDAGYISEENLYKLTGYRNIEALEKAQAEGLLINDYTGFNFKGKVNFTNIRETAVNFVKGVRDTKLSQLPKDKWGRSGLSEWYGFNPETKKREQVVPDFLSERIEKTGKTLDDIMEGTFNYLRNNQELTGVKPMLEKFAEGPNTPYQRYTYYKESEKAYNDWYNTYIVPTFSKMIDDNTLFGYFTPDQAGGRKGRNFLYDAFGKEKIIEIFYKSSSEEEFLNTLEKEIKNNINSFTGGQTLGFTDRKWYHFFNATDEGDVWTIGGKKYYTGTTIFKPVGLYDKLQENLKNVLENESIPIPPNIIPLGDMNTSSMVGSFAANVTQINAQAKDLFAPGTSDFIQANITIGNLSLDDDRYFAFANTITGANEISELFSEPGQRTQFNNIVKNMMNQYLATRNENVVNMSFSPIAKGSADNHSLKFTFPESFAKQYEKQMNAINPELYENFLAAGNSVTLVAPAGTLNEIPFVISSQYDAFEQHIMQKGTDGYMVNLVDDIKPGSTGVQLKFLYKDGGFVIEEYQNGRRIPNSFINNFYTVPGSATSMYNAYLKNGFIKF